jgi:hypothetical protein
MEGQRILLFTPRKSRYIYDQRHCEIVWKSSITEKRTHVPNNFFWFSQLNAVMQTIIHTVSAFIYFYTFWATFLWLSAQNICWLLTFFPDWKFAHNETELSELSCSTCVPTSRNASAVCFIYLYIVVSNTALNWYRHWIILNKFFIFGNS